MKRFICILLVLLLTASSALADTPQLSENMFAAAKEALGYLASGEYERLVTQLPYSDVAPSAAEWESFAKNFTDFEDLQTDYAVAYWTADTWKVAVPVQAPDEDDVEALVLTSDDGSSFTGYRYALWVQVETEYTASKHVIWNEEYVEGAPVVIAD